MLNVYSTQFPQCIRKHLAILFLLKITLSITCREYVINDIKSTGIDIAQYNTSQMWNGRYNKQSCASG
jgi:hypothetical protein